MHFYEQECGKATRSMVRYVLDRCRKIIVLSESWRGDLIKITRNPDITVLMNPVMRPLQRGAALTSDDNAILFLGRLGTRKGIYTLLEALVALKTRFPRVLLLCGGDGELDEVRTQVGRLGLRENVKILGWVREPEKSALLQSAAIYVLPSFAEGLPVSVLEAMAAGVPVISTPVGGIPEVITHGREGLLVPPGDVAALSEAICQLLADVNLRTQMGRNGALRFERDFSVEAVLAQLESVYRSLGVLPRAAVAATHSV